MLTEKRYDMILSLLEEKRSVTVLELKEYLNASESTIRRDLNALDRAGKLVKVFGGAVSAEMSFSSEEPSVEQKIAVNREEKKRIAQYAASLIEAGDCIYLDAGTTTGYMIDFITQKDISFITNAVEHAKRLAILGYHVFLVGGEFKKTTEALVGSQTVLSLQNYHFSKGFFGTNGLHRRTGHTTPDYNEALVKKTALGECHKVYFLCDSSKFGQVSSVTFATADTGTIISDARLKGDMADFKNIIVV